MAAPYTLWLLAVLAVHATLATQLSDAVRIRRVDVPSVVTLGAQPAVILDCDYDITDDSEGLVVKWFFGNQRNPVYQWIPPHRPQDLGALKGKLDLDYTVSDSGLQSQRALRIVSPGVALSGNYTCVVSTFKSEDRKTRPMLVFSPGHSLDFQYVRNESDDTVHLVCSIEDVYPQPTISIKRHSVPLPDQKVNAIPEEDGLFDLMALATANNTDLFSKEKFICEMKIPQANYTIREYITYYPRPETTTVAPPSVESSEDVTNNSTSDATSSTATVTYRVTKMRSSVVLLYVALIYLTTIL